jgi:hypothetical protein
MADNQSTSGLRIHPVDEEQRVLGKWCLPKQLNHGAAIDGDEELDISPRPEGRYWEEKLAPQAANHG